MSYAPKFYFEEYGDEAPQWLEEEFREITNGIYPTEICERLKSGGYNPIFIGIDHGLPLDFQKLIRKAFGEVLPERLKVGLEMMPQQFGWYKDFLHDVKEYNTSGMIRGETPSEEMVGKLKSYWRSSSFSTRANMACIETGMDILPLEHPDFQAWILGDRDNPLVEEESLWSGGLDWKDIQPAYTSIRREIHSLGVIDRERPEAIIVGSYHAMKYDLLLGRDGSRTRIYNGQNFRWSATMQMWRKVHDLYRKHLSVG